MRNWVLLILACAALLAPIPGWSQAYPTRPVRIIIGFGSGAPDTLARLVGHQMSVQMGQNFVVDNRPGAGGILAADMVAKAPPDGYTLMVQSGSFAGNVALYKKLPFDSVRDFTPVSLLAASEAFILVASPSLSARNVQELIALARAPGSRVSYGSNGIGTTGHLVGAIFNAAIKGSMVHVPYKAAAATLTGIITGEVQIMFATPALSLPQIKSGKLRALAYNNATRASFLPDVPTLGEQGAPSTHLIEYSWNAGLFAPAKVPPQIIARLESEARKAVATPEVRDTIVRLGVRPVGNTSAEFRQIVATAIKRFGEAAKIAGIEPE